MNTVSAHRDDAVRSRSRRARMVGGFTLIETIAAIVIFAVAIPAMMWALREAQQQRIDPIMTGRATWLATEKLEEIIADRHSSTRGWAYLIPANYPEEPEIDGFPAFTLKQAPISNRPAMVTRPSPSPSIGAAAAARRMSWRSPPS